MTEQQTTEVTLADLFTEETYSPYGLSVLVNEILTAAGIEKELPPQMFYNYTAKGYIETVDGNKGKGRKVSKEKALEWTERYLQKHTKA